MTKCPEKNLIYYFTQENRRSTIFEGNPLLAETENFKSNAINLFIELDVDEKVIIYFLTNIQPIHLFYTFI